MNYYEVLYIVNPNYGKDKISEIINDINTHIESKKHSILNHDFWGKKQLAYSVNKENMETMSCFMQNLITLLL